MALNISDDIKNHIKKVADVKNEEADWAIYGLDNDKAKVPNMVVAGSGTGGLSELTAFLSQDDAQDKIYFGALLAQGVDQQENLTSKRPKLVFITWLGPKMPAIKKARGSVLRPDVAGAFAGASVSIECNSVDSISQKELGKKLLSAGAAHKPTHFHFGKEQQIAVSELAS